MPPRTKIKHRYTDFGKDRIEVAKYVVKYKDVFSLEDLYKLMHEWLVEEGWATRNDEDFPETYFLQKESHVAGKEVWFRWRLQKAPWPAKYAFWRYVLDIDAHVLGLKPAELIWKGRKFKADKGEIEITVVASLVVDYGKAWEKTTWLKPLKRLWINRVVKRTKDMLKKALYDEAYRLREAITSYLKLESYLPEREEFWPKRTLE